MHAHLPRPTITQLLDCSLLQEQSKSGVAEEGDRLQHYVADSEAQPEHAKEHSESLHTSIESINLSSGRIMFSVNGPCLILKALSFPMFPAG